MSGCRICGQLEQSEGKQIDPRTLGMCAPWRQDLNRISSKILRAFEYIEHNSHCFSPTQSNGFSILSALPASSSLSSSLLHQPSPAPNINPASSPPRRYRPSNVVRPNVHLLTLNCQRLPQSCQRRKILHRPFRQSIPRHNSTPLPYLHFPTTSTARRHKSYQFTTSPNAAGTSIRLEYGRFKGTLRSSEKR